MASATGPASAAACRAAAAVPSSIPCRRPRSNASRAAAETSACTASGMPRSGPKATRRGTVVNAGSRMTLFNEASSGLTPQHDLARVLEFPDLADDAGACRLHIGEAHGAEHL